MPMIIAYQDENYDLSINREVNRLKKDISSAIEKNDFFYLTEIKKQFGHNIKKKRLDSKTKTLLNDQLSKIDDFFDEQDKVIKNVHFFPRSEYYTRFEGTTAFPMKDQAYWGTYHRSESTRFFQQAGGRKNIQFLSPCVEKPAKANSFFAHTGGVLSPFANKKYQKAIQLSVQAPITTVNFRDMALIYKVEMAKIVVESFSDEIENSQKLKVSRKIYTRPMVFSENDYPCVLINLPALNPLETKTEAAKYWSKHPKPFQKLLLASFVAFLNVEAYEAEIPIEMVIRASFGHNLPSICETDNTFRINVGLIPKCYAELIGKALNKLNNAISQLNDECATEPPFDNEFHAKIRRYNATKLKKSIDEKERYEKLGNMREYQTADSSNEAFERLYEAFLERNKDTSLVGSARFTPVRLQGDSVWAVIKEAGDSAAKSVLAECFREHEAVDWFSDMVFNALRKSPNENAIEIALYDLLSYLDFAETVTMDYAKMRRDLKPTKKLPFDDMSFESCYQDDEPFNKITQLLFDGLGAERPDINLYSAIERAGAIFFSSARGSKNPTKEPDYGSASEFSEDLTDDDDTIHFSHSKLRVCSGMKAIVLAHYGALSYLRQNGAKKIQQDIQQMYYEVEGALKMVKDATQVVNNIRGKLSNTSILHFDLNHCNASNSPHNVTLEEKLNDFKPAVVILDYTSSTVAQILEAQKTCLSQDNISLLILVDSGLKNNQAGLDFNPYGEVRVIARQRKIRNDVLDIIKSGLAEEDKMPQYTHELVRACKKRGFAPSFLGIFKTEEERFQVVQKTSVLGKQ
ncbi:MAG: hypothetical protein V4496_03800 [Pseudomonadota bacterium]